MTFKILPNVVTLVRTYRLSSLTVQVRMNEKVIGNSVTSKKLPIFYKSCPKMISLAK